MGNNNQKGLQLVQNQCDTNCRTNKILNNPNSSPQDIAHAQLRQQSKPASNNPSIHEMLLKEIEIRQKISKLDFIIQNTENDIQNIQDKMKKLDLNISEGEHYFYTLKRAVELQNQN